MGNSDPVLSLLKDFSYNVVRLPRTGIRPMQILEKQGDDLVVLGDITDLFTPGAAQLPPIGPDEQASFINGKRTRNLSISVGLSLLGGIIRAMTGTKLSLDVGYKKASALTFEFDDVKMNQVNQLQLSRFLTAARIDEAVGPPAKLLEADKLYIITNIIKSRKFTAEALSNSGKTVEVDVPVIKAVVGGSVGVKAEGGSSSKISYEGDVPLVFGFQAARIEFDKGAFKGFKQTGPNALRSLESSEGGDSAPEMLLTDAPFINFIDLLPEREPAVRARRSKTAAKKSGGKGTAGSKAAAKKKSGAKSGGSGKDTAKGKGAARKGRG